MTPLLAIKFGTTTAVALVTLPHAAATAVRCWRLRAHVDRTVLMRFGLLSAAGALAGALIYTRLGAGTLTRVLGGLLLLTAVAQLTGWASRWQPQGPVVAVLGLVSGFFGGIAGNQGGLRSGRFDGIWPSTAWIRRYRDGNRPPGRCGANTGLSLALGASTAHALGTHHRRHGRSPHRDHRGRAAVTGTVAAPFRPDHRLGNRRTRDLAARDADLMGLDQVGSRRINRRVLGLQISRCSQ